MKFEKGFIYHIYNQGNNKEQVFYNRKNYLYFLQKIGVYIKPFGDILAWCLMSNHFHLMVLVNELSLPLDRLGASPRRAESGSNLAPAKNRTTNSSIGLMIMSYSKALNKEQSRTGKLFREKTKAICLNCPTGITPSYFDTAEGTQIYQDIPEMQYPQVCFNYIHQNPVKAGLVEKPEDWEYSSFKDYKGLRNGKLVNKEIAAKYVIL